jgi:hypothetical protein
MEVAVIIIEDKHVGVTRAGQCEETARLISVDLTCGSVIIDVQKIGF